MSTVVAQENLVAGPVLLAWTPLVSSLPLSLFTP
jgi:hypothetical protein